VHCFCSVLTVVAPLFSISLCVMCVCRCSCHKPASARVVVIAGAVAVLQAAFTKLQVCAGPSLCGCGADVGCWTLDMCCWLAVTRPTCRPACRLMRLSCLEIVSVIVLHAVTLSLTSPTCSDGDYDDGL
jgi:hypothetical protein